MQAFEYTGTFSNNHLINLDTDLPQLNNKKVKLIILLPDEVNDEIDESKWYSALKGNDAFDILNEPSEDIYTKSDGKPFEQK